MDNRPKHVIIKIPVPCLNGHDYGNLRISLAVIDNFTNTKNLHSMTIFFICIQDDRCHLVTLNQLSLMSIGHAYWKRKIQKSPMAFQILWGAGLVRRGGRLLPGRIHLLQSFADLIVGEYSAIMRV